MCHHLISLSPNFTNPEKFSSLFDSLVGLVDEDKREHEYKTPTGESKSERDRKQQRQTELYTKKTPYINKIKTLDRRNQTPI